MLLAKLFLVVGLSASVWVTLQVPMVAQFTNSLMLQAETFFASSGSPSGLRVFSAEELKKYDGSDESLPLLLVVLGEVYDVSSGDKFYKKGEGYNIFCGQDASASFQTGDWKEPVADIRGMSPQEAEAVIGWRSFYQKSDKYPFVGVLNGLYYDADGNPTDALREVNQMESQAAEANSYEEKLRNKYPGCNMKSVTATKRTDIECPATDDGVQRFPRLVSWIHSASKAETKRCACFTKAQLAEKLPATMQAGPYDGCEGSSSHCVLYYE